MHRFRSVGQAQRFLSVHCAVQNLFRPGQRHLRSENHRWLRARSLREWLEATAVRGDERPILQTVSMRIGPLELTIPFDGYTDISPDGHQVAHTVCHQEMELW